MFRTAIKPSETLMTNLKTGFRRVGACPKATQIACMASLIVTTVWTAASAAPPPKPQVEGVPVASVDTEVRTVITTNNGLPSNDVMCVAALPTGDVFAGTTRGLAQLDGDKWQPISSVAEPVKLLAPSGALVYLISGNHLCAVRRGEKQVRVPLPKSAHSIDDVTALAAGLKDGLPVVLLATRSGLFELAGGNFTAVKVPAALAGFDKDIRHLAVAADGRVAVAAAGGLFVQQKNGTWERPNPVDGSKSWWPRDVRGVGFDSQDRLWFASPAGVGCFDGKKWSLYTGEDGLPYNDFTSLAAGSNGVVWFGTKMGAIRFDGNLWNYRQGRRWVPDDNVRSVAVSPNGDAWFATAHGLGRLERRAMKLADKAVLFETLIDKYHRRTPYGYIGAVSLSHPGDLSDPKQHRQRQRRLVDGDVRGRRVLRLCGNARSPGEKAGRRGVWRTAFFKPGDARRKTRHKKVFRPFDPADVGP